MSGQRPIPSPPRLAEWLLDRLRPQADGYAILGDLQEEYTLIAEESGVGAARRWYRWQVVRSLPWFLIQLGYWSLTMLSNYLTVAGRQLVKNWRYSVVNVTGLAVALACCVVAWLNYDFANRFDAFHKNAESLYRINNIRPVNDVPQEWGVSPMPLGPAVDAVSPHVDGFVRISQTSAVVQVGETALSEQVFFADASFFDLFTFPLRSGRTESLRNPDQVVLSPDAAERYFGDRDPVGESMVLRLSDSEVAVTVGAVVDEIPLNSSIRFDVLTSYANLGGDFDDWGRWGLVTFLSIPDPSNVGRVVEDLQGFVAPQNLARPDWEISRYYLLPLEGMYRTEDATRAYILQAGVPTEAVIGPSVLAVLLLLMACFNFVNTAMASASRRLKEIGVRKVMGGYRSQLLSQFLGESMLLCTIAFVGALLLAEVFAPAYSSLWPFLDLEISYTDNASLFGFLLALLLVTGLIAGGYPAIYISSFSPVSILRGRQRLGGLNLFNRALLTFQLATAVMVVMAAIVFARNAKYQEELDLGYDSDMVMVVPLEEPGDFPAFRDAALGNPDVLAVTGTRSHLNLSFRDVVAETLPDDRGEPVSGEVDLYTVGPGYLETMGISLAEGRDFLRGMESDRESAILVNQTFVRQFGLSEPVGSQVTIDSTRFDVVGVFEDFHDAGVWNPIDPAVFRPGPVEEAQFLVARVASDRLRQADVFFRATWQELLPGVPYEGQFQDEMLAEAVSVNRGIRATFSYLGLLAILIAAAGLFGLVSLSIARRTKEIGIRKVLGASLTSVGRLINAEFVWMLAIASVVATVGGYFSTKLLMDAIWAYHSGIGFLPPLLAILLMFGVALLTVGRQVYRVAAANPVQALRDE